MHPASAFGNRCRVYLLKIGGFFGKVCVFRINPAVAGVNPENGAAGKRGNLGPGALAGARDRGPARRK